MTKNNETLSLIESAARLHGHMGPFLVIGVRMGQIGKKSLGVDDEHKRRLQVNVKTPLMTPFSCTIDGVQASTSCTIGNQKLRIEASAKEIAATFKLEGSDKEIRVSVDPKIAETLVQKMSRGIDPEKLAAEISQMQEEQLFALRES